MMRKTCATLSFPLVWLFLVKQSWSLTSCASSPNHECISLVCWNLLAPVYAVPEKYPNVPLDALEWEHRQGLIVDKLKEMDADVYCLQELEVARWDEFIEKLPDYDGVLQDTKGKHPVATAILVKKASPLETIRTESRSRALLMVLNTHIRKEPLFLANVHLDAGSDSDKTRFFQLRSLLKRIIRHMDLEQISVSEQNKIPPIVVAGDMNMLRSTNVYSFLATGSHPSDESSTEATHRQLLPLQDAFADGPSGITFGQGGMVLDYVWTSKSVQVVNTIPVVPSNGVEMPSTTHPSDHLPIGVVLSLQDQNR